MEEAPEKHIKEKTDKPEVKKPILKKANKRKNSALSLNALQKKAEENSIDEPIQKNENLPREAFSKAAYQVEWEKYIDILNKQGEKMLGGILSAISYNVDKEIVRLTFPNSMMLEEVKKNQTSILNFLRDKLQNYHLKFDLYLDEKTEKKFIYTPQEKYEKLKEKNPLIEELRKKLHLDI